MNKRLFVSVLPYLFIGMCLIGISVLLMIPSAAGVPPVIA